MKFRPRPIRNQSLLITLALFFAALVAFFMTLPAQSVNHQDFNAGIADSIAYKTIGVPSAGVWNVQIEIMYSERQKQAYLDKVSRRIVSIGSDAPAEAWRPTQHLPLALTVSTRDHGSLKVVQEETVESEPFYGGGDHAGFLVVSQLHLDPGKYLVAIRTLKGDPTLGEFGARLLVGPDEK